VTLVVDSSALMAILLDEPAAGDIEFALDRSDELVISSSTFVEVTIVAESRLGNPGATGLERIIRHAEIAVRAVTESIARDTLDGWRRFGKGRHPASLNFGDCFSYGLARHLNSPILCTGNDFAQTDIEVLPIGKY
jgi:ribonuclease VapC